jgi:hypothetical protein
LFLCCCWAVLPSSVLLPCVSLIPTFMMLQHQRCVAGAALNIPMSLLRGAVQTTLPSCCPATTCCVSRAYRRSHAAAAGCSSARTALWRRGQTTHAHSRSQTCCDRRGRRREVVVTVVLT